MFGVNPFSLIAGAAAVAAVDAWYHERLLATVVVGLVAIVVIGLR